MPLSAGDKIGPYEILAPLGAGGMGEVYRARDTRLDRDVAVKVLPAHLADDAQALSRFEREGKAVAALSHPNILVLFDVGQQDGIHYCVTELLEGETLRERLARSPTPWRKVVELGVALAEGLAAAHGKEIVHRDIKPANIFLTTSGQVKILDFGLAGWEPKAPSGDDTLTLGQTQQGSVMGTIGYMSPEQVRGEKAGAASDIFSLGCVLYEAMTGRKAFSGKSGADTMAAILKEDPPSILDTGVQSPAELARVIDRCLAKNPAQRFHSAHDLAFALKGLGSVTEEKPLNALPPRSRHGIWIATAAAIVAAGAGGWVYWDHRSAPGIDSLAVLPFVNMSGSPDAEYLSDGIAESLRNSLSELPDLKVMSSGAVARYKGKQTDAVVIGKELGVRAVLSGKIVERGDKLTVSAELVDVSDNSHLWGAQYSRSVADALAMENEIGHQIAEKLRLHLSGAQMARMTTRQTANPEAYQLYLKGRYFAAQFTPDALKKGMDYFQQAVALDPNYALAYDGMSYYYALSEDLVLPPHEAMPKAKAAALKALELDDSLVEAHTDLANVNFFYDFDWAAAEKGWRRAIELNPNYPDAYEYYAWFLMMVRGQAEQAIQQGQKSVALSPVTPENRSILGWVYYGARQYDQAVATLQKCLELDPDYWMGHAVMGQVHAQQGKFDEAIADEKKAIAVFDNTFARTELARAYVLAGRKAEGLQTLKDLTTGPLHRSAYGVATVYAALGDKDRALAELEKAYEERSFFMDFLARDPELDNLRGDPRFAALMRKMNLQ